MKKAYMRPLLLLTALMAVLILIFSADYIKTAFRNRREQACLPAVYAASKEFQVPPAMILAVIRTESDFHPQAVSEAGAVGLMQLMPDTFRYLTDDVLQENLTDDVLTDPATNIRYGSCYLAELYADFNDWPTALAAYNAGEGRVRIWLKDDKISPGGILTHIPFPETAAYVQNVLDAYTAYGRKYEQNNF